MTVSRPVAPHPPGQVAHEGARRVANRGRAHRALQHGGEEGAEELVRDGPQLLFALLRFLCRPGRWSTRLKLQRPPEGSAQVDGNVAKIDLAARGVDGALVHFNAPSCAVRAVMSSTTLPVCPKTGSTSPSLTVHLCLHTVPGNRECALPTCAAGSAPAVGASSSVFACRGRLIEQGKQGRATCSRTASGKRLTWSNRHPRRIPARGAEAIIAAHGDDGSGVQGQRSSPKPSTARSGSRSAAPLGTNGTSGAGRRPPWTTGRRLVAGTLTRSAWCWRREFAAAAGGVSAGRVSATSPRRMFGFRFTDAFRYKRERWRRTDRPKRGREPSSGQ